MNKDPGLYQESWLRVIDGTDPAGCLSKYLTRILKTYWGCVLVAGDGGMLFMGDANTLAEDLLASLAFVTGSKH